MLKRRDIIHIIILSFAYGIYTHTPERITQLNSLSTLYMEDSHMFALFMYTLSAAVWRWLVFCFFPFLHILTCSYCYWKAGESGSNALNCILRKEAFTSRSATTSGPSISLLHFHNRPDQLFSAEVLAVLFNRAFLKRKSILVCRPSVFSCLNIL